MSILPDETLQKQTFCELKPDKSCMVFFEMYGSA